MLFKSLFKLKPKPGFKPNTNLKHVEVPHSATPVYKLLIIIRVTLSVITRAAHLIEH